MYEEKYMRQALALSARALQEPGTEPFGAVVVLNGVAVGEGFNHSVAHFDPTSHGEIEAIRDACRKLERVELTGADMYTSCEPCALCVAAMNIVGIRRLFYAASLEQSGQAFEGVTQKARHDIDIHQLRREAGATLDARSTPSEQHLAAEAVKVLSDWASTRRG